MNELIFILSLGIPLLLGFTLLAMLDRRGLLNRWELASLAFPLGSAAVTLSAFLHGRILGSLSGMALPGILLALICPLLLAGRLRRSRTGLEQAPALLPSIGLLFVLLVLLGILTVVPAARHDAVSIWLFKGSAFHHDNALSPPLFESEAYLFTHPEYPLHVPLLHTWNLLWNGGGRLGTGGWPSALLLLSWVSLLYLTARRLSGSAFLAGLLLLLFLLTPHVMNLAVARTAELPLAVYLTAVLFLLIRLEESNCPAGSKGLLAGLFLAGAAWTKLEGQAILPLVFLPALLWCRLREGKPGLREGAGLVLPGALVGAAWWLLRPKGVTVGILQEEFGPADRLLGWAERLPVVLSSLGGEMFRFEWALFWPAAIAGLFCRLRSFSHRLLRSVFLLHLLLYLGVYLNLEGDLHWYLETTIHRLLFHLGPAAFLLIASALGGGERFRRRSSDCVRYAG